MSYQTQGTIQYYNAATNACLVELTGIGMTDTWLDGISPEAQVNRAFLRPGNACTLSMPDPNRLCEAKIVAVTGDATGLLAVTPTATQITQTGLINIDTGFATTGSTHITFSPAFSAAPTVNVVQPQFGSVSVTNVTATGFDAAVTASHNWSHFTIPWHAVGNQ